MAEDWQGPDHARWLTVRGGKGQALRVIFEMKSHEHLSATYVPSLRGCPNFAMDGNIPSALRKAWPDLKVGDRVRISIDRIDDHGHS